MFWSFARPASRSHNTLAGDLTQTPPITEQAERSRAPIDLLKSIESGSLHVG